MAALRDRVTPTPPELQAEVAAAVASLRRLAPEVERAVDVYCRASDRVEGAVPHDAGDADFRRLMGELTAASGCVELGQAAAQLRSTLHRIDYPSDWGADR